MRVEHLSCATGLGVACPAAGRSIPMGSGNARIDRRRCGEREGSGMGRSSGSWILKRFDRGNSVSVYCPLADWVCIGDWTYVGGSSWVPTSASALIGVHRLAPGWRSSLADVCLRNHWQTNPEAVRTHKYATPLEGEGALYLAQPMQLGNDVCRPQVSSDAVGLGRCPVSTLRFSVEA